MNYALRCMPPSCIAQQATAFDDMVIGAAQTKLLLHPDEAKRHPTLERLRAPLRHGGFGLTSALKTSPAAFLGSMAAVAAAPVFAPYTQPGLSSTVQLAATRLDRRQHADSPQRCTDIAGRDGHMRGPAATICSGFLPPLRPSLPLYHEQLRPRTSARAQLAGHRIHIQGLPAAREEGEEGGWREVAGPHEGCVSPEGRGAWKSVSPTSKELELTDTQYRIAARLNLGLQPVEGAAALPDSCLVCLGNDTPSVSTRGSF